MSIEADEALDAPTGVPSGSAVLSAPLILSAAKAFITAEQLAIKSDDACLIRSFAMLRMTEGALKTAGG
jgi:hypothetical protein